jgi:hypothetical protein
VVKVFFLYAKKGKVLDIWQPLCAAAAARRRKKEKEM